MQHTPLVADAHPYNEEKERKTNMATLGKITAATVLFSAALIVAGCAELQQLADSALPPIDRIQRQLQSQNKQVRMAALDEAANIESQFVLQNLILGQALKGHPDDRPIKVNYPDDVRIGAVDKLFEKGKILTLIGLAKDYRIGGGKVALVEGDNSLTSHIKTRIRTIDGLEKLCKETASLQWKNDWTAERWHLLGKENPDDPCPLSNECLVWAVRHSNEKAIKNIFDIRSESAGTAGANAVSEMTDYDSLKIVAMDKTCLIYPRLAAAGKLFKHNNLVGSDILPVIASLEEADDSQMTELAQAGLSAAKRIGANDVVNALGGK